MRIDKLTLTNFRGLTNSTLDFAPGFNLIIGINGAGKTAVLDALRILLARALPDMAESRPFHGIGLTKEDITVGRGQTYIQFKILSRNQIFSLALSEQRDVTRNAVDSKTGLKDIRDVEELPRLRHGERPERGDLRLEGTLRGQTSNRPEVVGILEPEPTRSFKKSRPQPLVLYLSVRRAIENGRVSRASGSPAYQNIFENDRGLELKRLADWWKGREELAHEASQSQSGKQLAAITGALARLLPHLSDWRIENKALTVCKIVDVEQMNDRGEKIFVNESRRLVVGFLSDGERSLIAIGADIARRLALLNGESESPLDDGEGVDGRQVGW